MVMLRFVFLAHFGHFLMIGATSPLARPILNTSSTTSLGRPFGFTFPMLGRGGVLFQGSFPHTSALLVFDAATGGLAHAVRTGVPMGPDNNTFNFTGFGDFDFAGLGRIAFIASAITAKGNRLDGVFLSLPGEGIFPIVTTETFFEPAGCNFTGFSGAAISLEGTGSIVDVVFSADAGAWSGIVFTQFRPDTRNNQLKLSVVADSRTPIPGSPGLFFKCLGSQTISDEGHVVFFGSHCEEASVSASVRSQHASRGLFRTEGLQRHCLTFNGRGFGMDHVFPGIFRWSTQMGLQVIADATTIVPRSTSAKETFVGFSDPAIGSDGTVAFVAEGSEGSLGVYASRLGYQLRAVATTSTTVPGNKGVVFGDFPYVPSVGRGGKIYFYASVQGTLSGVYSGYCWKVVPPDSVIVQAELTLGDKIKNQSLVYIGFGTDAYEEAADAFAAYLVLGDGTDGIWHFDSHGTEQAGVQAVV